jgi:hypothetical protein
MRTLIFVSDTVAFGHIEDSLYTHSVHIREMNILLHTLLSVA